MERIGWLLLGIFLTLSLLVTASSWEADSGQVALAVRCYHNGEVIYEGATLDIVSLHQPGWSFKQLRDGAEIHVMGTCVATEVISIEKRDARENKSAE